MPCPKCGGVMGTHNRSGAAIELCSQCGGIFLDYGELEALKQREGHLPMMQTAMGSGGPAPHQGAMLACPKCGAAMRTYQRSGVSIEQCDRCRGVFLDHGEIDQIKQRERSAPRPPGWAAQGPYYNQPQQYYQHPGYYHRRSYGYGHPHPHHIMLKTGWELLFST